MKKEYKRLSHSIWMCTYHIVFCPKYLYQVLEREVEVIVRNELYRLCGQKDAVEIKEINIQTDHVHMVVDIPPKYAVSTISEQGNDSIIDFKFSRFCFQGTTGPTRQQTPHKSGHSGSGFVFLLGSYFQNGNYCF